MSMSIVVSWLFAGVIFFLIGLRPGGNEGLQKKQRWGGLFFTIIGTVGLLVTAFNYLRRGGGWHAFAASHPASAGLIGESALWAAAVATCFGLATFCDWFQDKGQPQAIDWRIGLAAITALCGALGLAMYIYWNISTWSVTFVSGEMLVLFITGLIFELAVAGLLYLNLKAIPQKFRPYPSWMAIIVIVPVVAWVWVFYIFIGLAKAYRAYFKTLGHTEVGDCGLTASWAYCILTVAVQFNFRGSFRFLNLAVLPAQLLFLIIALVKFWRLRQKISAVCSGPTDCGAAAPRE